MIKYTKKLSALACAVILVAFSTVTFFASGNEYYSLTDDAHIFTEAQISEFSEKMEAIGQKTGWQIIVHTSLDGIDSYDMDRYYNDEYYDTQSFEENSVMLVIDVASDNRIILTHGDVVEYFSDERMSVIKSEMKPYLLADDMYQATLTFLETTEEFFDEGADTSGSFDNYVDTTENRLREENKLLYVLKNYGIIMGVVAVVVGGIVVIVVYNKYKNNGKSGTYDLHANSVTNLTEKEDIFMHQTVTSRTIPRSTSSGGGSSGSSGSSHGSSGSF